MIIKIHKKLKDLSIRLENSERDKRNETKKVKKESERQIMKLKHKNLELATRL